MHGSTRKPTIRIPVLRGCSFKNVLGERARLTLWLLMGAATFVLIISAANVANLALMRGVRREHELVVRAALGAGAGRLRRLLLAENLALTILGATLGMVIAVAGIGPLTSLAERYSPRASEIRLDVVVLAFALTLSVLLASLLAFVAWLPKEGGLAVAISTGARRASGGLRKQRLQRALVVVQVAVSVVLLAGAGLLTRTLIRLAEVDTGLTTEEVLTMQGAPHGRGPVESRRPRPRPRGRYERMRSEIAALRGSWRWALAPLTPPLGGCLGGQGGRESARRGRRPTASRGADGQPAFFRAAGIPLLQGRPFASTDGPVSAEVVILNQTLATQLFLMRIPWSADRVDRGNRATLPVQRRLAYHRRRGRQHPRRRTGRGATAGGLRAARAAGGARRKPGDPGRQQRRAPGGAATRIVRRIAPSARRGRDECCPVQGPDSPRRLNAVLVSSFGILAVIIAAVGIAGVLGSR